MKIRIKAIIYLKYYIPNLKYIKYKLIYISYLIL